MRRLFERGGGIVVLVATALACAEGTNETVFPPNAPQDGGSDSSVSLPDGGGLPPTGDGGSSGSSGGPDGSAPPVCDEDVIVINEVMTAGAGNANEEFIELFNPNDCEVSLSGLELKYKSAAGNGPTLFTFGNEKMAARSFFVVGTSAFSGARDATMTGGLAADGGSIGLMRGNATVDAVGWGNATSGYFEGPRAPAPPGGDSLGRKTDGVETDDNNADFAVQTTPTPGGPN